MKQSLLQPAGGEYFESLDHLAFSDEIASTDKVLVVRCDFTPELGADGDLCAAMLVLPNLPATQGPWRRQYLADFGWQYHPWAGVSPGDITARCPIHICHLCEVNLQTNPDVGASAACWESPQVKI